MFFYSSQNEVQREFKSFLEVKYGTFSNFKLFKNAN